MTSCSLNFFNLRLGERDNMKPINELLQAAEAQKSVDQDTNATNGSGSRESLRILSNHVPRNPSPVVWTMKIRRALPEAERFHGRNAVQEFLKVLVPFATRFSFHPPSIHEPRPQTFPFVPV